MSAADTKAKTNQPPPLDLYSVLAPDVLSPFLDERFGLLKPRFDLLMASYDRFKGVTNNGIKTEEIAQKCVDLVKQLKGHVKTVEEVRVAVKDPVQRAVNDIDGRGREMTKPLVDAAVEAEKRWKVFKKNQEAIIRLRAAEEAAAREAEAAVLIDQAMETGDQALVAQAAEIADEAALASEIAAAPTADLTRTRSSLGTASLRPNWKYRIVDFAKLGDAYKVHNDKVIMAAIKSGARQIEGLEIYDDRKATFR